MGFLNVSGLSARLPVRVRVSLSLAVLLGEVCISLISLLVPFLHFAMVQESTIVLNLQIHNVRRDTHTMAQEFQQSHLCGIVELGSVRLSVSCLSVPRIKKVDCKDRAQPTPETGIDLPVGAVDQFTAQQHHGARETMGPCNASIQDGILDSSRFKSWKQICEYLEKARLHPTGRHWVDNLITPTLLAHQFLRSEREGYSIVILLHSWAPPLCYIYLVALPRDVCPA